MTSAAGKVLWAVLGLALLAGAAGAAEDPMRGPWEKPAARAAAPDSDAIGLSYTIGLYQRFVAPISGSSCPMEPHCSAYARDCFRRHGPVGAWILTSDRLLRCGRDEVRTAPRIWRGGRLLSYDPVSANDFWWPRAAPPP